MAELMTNPHPDQSTRKTSNSEQSIGEVDSRLLLGKDGRIRIRHNGQIYELRETRFGKLILTK